MRVNHFDISSVTALLKSLHESKQELLTKVGVILYAKCSSTIYSLMIPISSY